jgi:subtilisin-like proprotein convertase family protein
MQKFWRFCVLALIAVIALDQSAFAYVAGNFKLQKNGKKIVTGQRVLRPEMKTSRLSAEGKSLIGENVEVKRDAKSKQVRLLRGQMIHAPIYNLKSATKADFLNVINEFIGTNEQLFSNLNQFTMTLDEKAGLRTEKDQVFKFRLTKDGLHVKDANIDFYFQRGQLVQVVNQSFTEASPDTRLSATNLKQIVVQTLGTENVRHLEQIYRVVPSKHHYQLTKVDVFEVTYAGEIFDVQVESATGTIFQVTSRNHYMSGQANGQVYDRYYKDPLTVKPFGELNLSAKTGAVLTDMNGVFSAGATDEPTLLGLTGLKVNVLADTGALVNQEAAVANGAFDINVAKDASPLENDPMMAQAMIYYHANLMINFAKKYITTPWFDETLVANANLSSTCNAHWDGSTINFYSADRTCANTGLISDVVYHEWGHGLDHNTGGIDDGAYSEGFGDIMSLVMTGSNVLGIGFRTNGGAVRDLSPDKIYPQDTGGGVHSEGQIIGSAFYDLLVALEKKHGPVAARDLLAQYAFKSIMTATRYTDVYDALVILDDDDANPATTSTNFCVLNEVFAAHGLATMANSCLLGTITSFNTQEVSGNNNDVIEPGETVTLSVNYLNNTGINISQLSAYGQITPATEGITLSSNPITWNEVANGSSQRSNGVLRLELSEAVACGTQFGITFNMESRDPARNAVQIHDFAVGKNIGVAESEAAAGLPLGIPDLEKVSATVEIGSTQWASDTTVLSGRLKFDIKHSYIGDVTVTLISPAGERIEVFQGDGAEDDSHFDKDISELVLGKAGKGTWTLEVIDDASSDVGTLESFSLTLTPHKFLCE